MSSHRLRRQAFAAICSALVLFVAYGSLVPFDLRQLTWREAFHEFIQIRAIDPFLASRTDLISNIILFVPVGLTLSGAVDHPLRHGGRWFCMTAALLFSFGLSLTLEFLQIFVVGRTPSLNDVGADCAGALLGAATWSAVGDRFLTRMAAFLVGQPAAAPRAAATAAAAVLLLVMQWSPFDFTLRPAELAEKLRAGRISLSLWIDDVSRLDAIPYLSLCAAVGFLASGTWKHWQPPRSAMAMPPFVACLIVWLAEGGQVLVASRSARFSDVVMGTAAALAGSTVSLWIAPAERAGRPRDGGVLTLIAALAASLAVFVWSWRPFDFLFESSFVHQRLEVVNWLPLRSYFAVTPLEAVVDASAKLPLAVLLGALYVGVLPRTWQSVWRAIIVGALSAAIYLASEIGQLFLPSRYPDVSDVLIGAVGSLAGAFTMIQLQSSRDGRTSRRQVSRPGG